MIITGDIGGTKTILSLYPEDEGIECEPLAETTFSSQKYDSLEDIIQQFLDSVDYAKKIKTGVFAVAGPIKEGTSTITNLPWIIDAFSIKTQFHLETVHLLNDLESIAYYVPYLTADELLTLREGERKDKENMIVVAPGTGLGEAFLTYDSGTKRYKAHACEGGHVDFAPIDELQDKLLEYLQKKYGRRVSVERVCSGIGIENIYEFLQQSEYTQEEAWLRQELETAEDPVPIISKTAIQHPGKSDIADLTMKTFVSIFGTEVGNFALKILSTGGIYLSGGIPSKITPLLKQNSAILGSTFMDAVDNKGRMKDVVHSMPIHIILNTKICALGAKRYAFDNYVSTD